MSDLVIGAFIFDQKWGATGVVEELAYGLVKYSVRGGPLEAREHCHWTDETCVTVLLDQFPGTDDFELGRLDRLRLDVLTNRPRFTQEPDGRIFWQDADGKTYEVEMNIAKNQT